MGITLAHKRQKNVIGCFLGSNLVPASHGCDIFNHFMDVLALGKPRYKKFTPKEDQIILNEVANKGNKLVTWKALSVKIKGDERSYDVIRKRYMYKLSVGSMKHGRFTLEEDT